jgi:hypothetical protein
MISTIRTMTRVKRIPVLALFFVSAMEFILERGGDRSCAYDGCTRDLVMGRVAEAIAAGARRQALPQWRGNNVHCTPRQHSGLWRRWDG